MRSMHSPESARAIPRPRAVAPVSRRYIPLADRPIYGCRMQFFLFDFALAFVALLGYRTLVVVTRQGAPAGSLARTGKLHRRPGAAPWPDIARPRRRIEPQ